MKTFGGPVMFLDRSDINTDEIIPAKYLTEVKKEALAPYLLEDLKLDGFDPKGQWRGTVRVVISRENFGCGSSREHAPWAFEVNDITCVIAQNFARIFRQNMFNGGMMALEFSKESIQEMFALKNSSGISCDVNLQSKVLTFSAHGKELKKFAFSLSEFDEALVKAGGWVEFADSKY